MYSLGVRFRIRFSLENGFNSTLTTSFSDSISFCFHVLNGKILVTLLLFCQKTLKRKRKAASVQRHLSVSFYLIFRQSYTPQTELNPSFNVPITERMHDSSRRSRVTDSNFFRVLIASLQKVPCVCRSNNYINITFS